MSTSAFALSYNRWESADKMVGERQDVQPLFHFSLFRQARFLLWSIFPPIGQTCIFLCLWVVAVCAPPFSPGRRPDDA